MTDYGSQRYVAMVALGISMLVWLGVILAMELPLWVVPIIGLIFIGAAAGVDVIFRDRVKRR